MSGPPAPPVTFALAFHTWADAAARDFSWSADQMAYQLVHDSTIPSVVVSDPLRSHLGRVKRRAVPPNRGFPTVATRSLVHPRRWARGDGADLGAAQAYRHLDDWLRRSGGGPQSVLVTCHPVHAAVADRSNWRDVVYFAWDDWLEYPPLADSRDLYAWSYREMAERDVKVIGVSRAVVEHVGARRSWVVPNGVAPESFQALPPLPQWLGEIRRPIAFYAGALEQRVDVASLARTAAEMRDWSFLLVGPMTDPARFADLASAPNVHIRPAVPRPQVLAIAAVADVCLIPHRETPMSRAMSPLKLYEYLASGRPVVASDLEPMRGVSERCLLVPCGESMTESIRRAAHLPAQPEADRHAFMEAHSWSSRYQVWRTAALDEEADRNEVLS